MALTRKAAAAAALLLVYNLLPVALAPPRKGAERGVRLALIRLNDLLAKRDMAIVEEFSTDVQFSGSEPGERAQGREELTAFFEGLYGLSVTLAFSWRAVNVEVRGDVAWLYAEGDFLLRGDAGETRKPYRASGVLELIAGQWRWRMFHGSQPASA